MTGFDLSTISAVYVGDTSYNEIYLGSTKIWPSTQHDYSQDYFTIELISSGYPISIGFAEHTTYDYISNTRQTLEYSADDGNTWNTYTIGYHYNGPNGSYTECEKNYITLTPYGFQKKVIFRGTLNTHRRWPDSGKSQIFMIADSSTSSSTNSVYAYGNLGSLIYGDNFYSNMTTTLSKYCFSGFFADRTFYDYGPQGGGAHIYYTTYDCHIHNFSHLILPLGLSEHCYEGLFADNPNVCVPPALPATTLADYCYAYMFHNCTSLIYTPALPATTLADYCYQEMFRGCTSLIYTPALPATTLADYCYQEMFRGCTSLNEVHCYATDISATNCLTNWLVGVSQTGNFYKDANTTYSSGASGIPANWTIHNV